MNEITKTPTFTDEDIECCDCAVTFTWLAGEQSYFWSKGLSKPRRCPSCRKYRRLSIVRDDDRRWHDA